MGHPAGLKFRLYVRRDNKYVELHSIQRSATGLYLNETRWSLGKSGFSHTYHESGKRWDKLHRQVLPGMKSIDRPLADFEGQLSVITGLYTVLSGDSGLSEERVELRPEDIVLERGVHFGLEIIISDQVIDLPTIPARLNSSVYVKDSVFPVIIVEAWDAASNVMSRGRFPRSNPLVEGETLFFTIQRRYGPNPGTYTTAESADMGEGDNTGQP